MQLHEKNIVVIGAARSGLAAAKLLKRNGAHVLLSEFGEINDVTQQELRELGIRFEHHGHSNTAYQADVAVVSPGIPDEAPIVASYLQSKKPVLSEIELASRFCTAPMIAVTGSNGKTTVASWLGHVWSSAGHPHHVAGNIGTAFSDIAENCSADHWAILEVSSFQLDHINRFHPRVSSILNITPDHLDRYQNQFNRYVASKMRIISNQTRNDIFVYWNDDVHIKASLKQHPASCTSWTFSASTPVNRGIFLDNDTLTWSFDNLHTPLMAASEISLPGSHNLLNAMATALIARAGGIPDVAIRTALSNFRGVEHRLELVRELQGVRYYNDSKATNVDAVWHALQSLPSPIVLIMGGQDKGNDYSKLADVLREKTCAVIAIGKAIPMLMDQVKPHVSAFQTAETMQEAVHKAQSLSIGGASVLLSPACASFDMFRNYEHRGLEFKSAVMALEAQS
ncbi:MAG: UDP-N-acetylmuramoyl-L-alanine--D-glutamate ligase [Bacteroidetes bacterium]|nr:UDP-N-acetylmuramoyl-L-alanine--D-glutamate ligase [Bacteroidota bacterium]MCH8525080.1 UDP-N-acetylmuramoyl-L-alanine--D-glutamate ligase [Balneolales bacterium]